MSKREKVGFTLVEIMVVCSIIGILAAVLLSTSFTRAMRYKENAEVADKMRTATQAFELYELENGRWPANRSIGIVPPEMSGYYFEYYGISWWTSTVLGSGEWDWDNLSEGGTTYYAVVIAGLSDSQMKDLDVLLDDGNIQTGNFKKGIVDNSANRTDYGCLLGTD